MSGTLTFSDGLLLVDSFHRRYGNPRAIMSTELHIAASDEWRVRELFPSSGPSSKAKHSAVFPLITGMPVRATVAMQSGVWLLFNPVDPSRCRTGHWPWWEPPLPRLLSAIRQMAKRISDTTTMDWLNRFGRWLIARKS